MFGIVWYEELKLKPKLRVWILQNLDNETIGEIWKDVYRNAIEHLTHKIKYN